MRRFRVPGTAVCMPKWALGTDTAIPAGKNRHMYAEDYARHPSHARGTPANSEESP